VRRAMAIEASVSGGAVVLEWIRSVNCGAGAVNAHPGDDSPLTNDNILLRLNA